MAFSSLIFGGTLLLKLPISTKIPINWIDALFTATSACTVTGLNTVDTASTYTIFGQVVILLLIQLGGLGIMSFAILFFIMLGKKIGFKERLLMQQALNQNRIGGVIKLLRNLFIISFSVELVAMFFLSLRWVPEFGWSKGLYYSLFHSISAFNNAGFALWADNITRYVGDPIINITLAGLFIIGGLGFTVILDIITKRSFKKLSLHSKIMIVSTIALNLISIVVLFILEFRNPGTLANLPTLSDKLWASFFQATSPRTAGFNSINIGAMHDSSIFFTTVLMFIGFIRGKSRVVLAKRSIHESVLIRSLSVAIIAFIFVNIATFILTLTENQKFIALLFEVVSAFGTVGLSMGITSSLSFVGKIVIIVIMFLGKIGPLTFILSFSRKTNEPLKYPEEDILIG
ncbi:MAG: Ktr system potassium transporter [Bacillales bacterium]|nr:Ktr system potassium transporter [Bacillales bacterium]